MTSQVAGSWSRLKCLIYRARILVPALLLLAFGLIWCALCPSEQAFRRWGLSFQIVGLLLVMFQLRRTAKAFGHPSPLSSVLVWLRELCAAFAPPSNHLKVVMAAGTASGSGTASAVGARANPSIEDRLNVLEAAVTAMRTMADERQAANVQRFETIDARINSETQSRRAAHEKLSDKVKDQAVGDLYPALIGVFMTLVGTVASTLPQELACLFGG